MTTERATKILIEVNNGKNVDPKDTPEEAAYRKRLVKEIADIKKKKGTVDIPPENP